MMDFEDWIKITIPKWSNELLQLGATWDTFLPFVNDSSTSTGSTIINSKGIITNSSSQHEEDSLINDLVKSGIPLLSARGIIAKVKEAIERSKASLTIYWDFDSIPIPAISVSTYTAVAAAAAASSLSISLSDDTNTNTDPPTKNETINNTTTGTTDNGNDDNIITTTTLNDVLVRLRLLLSSYGSSVTLRGYAENIANAVSDEQKQQLCKYFDNINFIDSSAIVSGMDISTKRIIIDSMKSECNNTISDTIVTICYITADIDFAYLLSALDRNKVCKIFISATESIKSIPDQFVTIKFDWENDIVYPPKSNFNSSYGKLLLSEIIERNKSNINSVANNYHTATIGTIGSPGGITTTGSYSGIGTTGTTNTGMKIEQGVANGSSVPTTPNRNNNNTAAGNTGIGGTTTATTTTLIQVGTSNVHMYVRGFEKEIQKDGKLRTKRGRCLYCKQKKTMHYCNHHSCSSQHKKCWLCINTNNTMGDINRTCFALYHKGKF